MSTAVQLGHAEPDRAPTPLWIGSGLFGWFTPAAAGAPARNAAILLCNPFGYEAMCTHRTYRKLAGALSSAGYASLRFDWPGTGDSEGDEPGGNLHRWPASLHAAAAELRARAGVDAVILFGLRLGGTLALAHGGSVEGVEAAVAWAPHRSGKELHREVRAFRMLKEQPAPSIGGEGAEEAAGYLLTSDDVRALGEIDLARAGTPPRQVLLLGRDDIPQDGAVAAALGKRGSSVTSAPLPGYAALMRDALESVVPEAAIGQTVAWLESLELHPRPRPVRLLSEVPHAPHGEQFVRFGPARRLFGVFTPAARECGRPVVLLPNTGSNHHVGPNRLGVRLARQLAREGFPSLRFDVGGVGDSLPDESGAENRIYAAVSIEDLRAAVDAGLAQSGAPGAAVFGICSGAYLGYRVFDDPRITGQVLVNLQTFDWKEGDSLEYAVKRTAKSMTFYRRAFLDPDTWRRFFRMKIDLRHIAAVLWERLQRRVRQEGTALLAMLREGRYEHSDVARQFQRLSARGGMALVIYSTEDGGLDVMQDHLGSGAKKMQGRRGFTLRLVDGPDHTFTQVWSQLVLLELVASHLLHAFPVGRAE